MMNVAPDIAVGGQITAADVAALAAKGFRSLICNRPDSEVSPDLRYAAIEAAAKAAGVDIRYIPIIPGKVGMPEVEALAKALEEMPRPILAYCRTGARSGQMCQVAMNYGATQIGSAQGKA